MTARLYLDFDGCVRPFRAADATGWSEETGWSSRAATNLTNHGLTVPVSFAPDLVERISRAVSNGLQLVYVTDWERDTAQFTRLGFPPAPWLRLDAGPTQGFDSDLFAVTKGHAVRQHLTSHPADAVVWVDDELSAGAELVAEELGIHTLVPDYTLGITRPDWEEIARLLRLT